MSFDTRRDAIRSWGLPAITAFAVILIAAGVEIDQNLARLKTMPREERARLVENLRKFDLVLSKEQQRALRDIDRRISTMEPAQQAEYLSAMRRYHNWLSRLPDARREELLSKPPLERMSLISKLAALHPVPRADTPRALKIVDPGEFSPFELAGFFKIWQALSAAQRQSVEKVPLGPMRDEAVFKLGLDKEIPREIKPADFDEEVWMNRIEAQPKKARSVLLLDELKRKQQQRWAQIVRRQAMNLYFMQHPPAPVTSERLEQFVASFPDWVQATFDSYPPDEARRRLTIVYRLAFPPPEEIKLAPRPTAPAPRAPTPATGGGARPSPRDATPF